MKWCPRTSLVLGDILPVPRQPVPIAVLGIEELLPALVGLVSDQKVGRFGFDVALLEYLFD